MTDEQKDENAELAAELENGEVLHEAGVLSDAELLEWYRRLSN